MQLFNTPVFGDTPLWMVIAGLVGLIIGLALCIYLVYKMKMRPQKIDNRVFHNQRYYDQKKFNEETRNFPAAAQEKAENARSVQNHVLPSKKSDIINPSNSTEWRKKLRPRLSGFFHALILKPSKKEEQSDQDTMIQKLKLRAASALRWQNEIYLAKREMMRELVKDMNDHADEGAKKLKDEMHKAFNALWSVLSTGTNGQGIAKSIKSEAERIQHINDDQDNIEDDKFIEIESIKDLLEKKYRSYNGLQHFRLEHGLARRNVHSVTTGDMLIHWSLFGLILLLESIANGMFFAQKLEGGIIGGFSVAIIFSALNLAGAIALGYCFKYTNLKPISFWKVGPKHGGFWAWLYVIIFSIGIVLFNLFIGAYRSELGGDSTISDASARALNNVYNHWFGALSSIESITLFIMGLVFAAMAAAKSYRWKDICPGFYEKDAAEKLHRKNYDVEKITIDKTALDYYNETDSDARAFEDFLNQAPNHLRFIHGKQIEEATNLQKLFSIVHKTMNEMLRMYSTTNKNTRRFYFSKPPTYLAQPIALESEDTFIEYIERDDRGQPIMLSPGNPKWVPIEQMCSPSYSSNEDTYTQKGQLNAFVTKIEKAKKDFDAKAERRAIEEMYKNFAIALREKIRLIEESVLLDIKKSDLGNFNSERVVTARLELDNKIDEINRLLKYGWEELLEQQNLLVKPKSAAITVV